LHLVFLESSFHLPIRIKIPLYKLYSILIFKWGMCIAFQRIFFVWKMNNKKFKFREVEQFDARQFKSGSACKPAALLLDIELPELNGSQEILSPGSLCTESKTTILSLDR
jgi:hypothetical protein